MKPEWEELISPMLNLETNQINALWEKLAKSSEEQMSSDDLKIKQLCRILNKLDDWPPEIDQLTLLRNGIYSPIQLLLWNAARETKSQLDLEYPFLFSTIGMTLELILNELPDMDEDLKQTNDWDVYHRRLLQVLFGLREVREEQEPLSIELSLPLKKTDGDALSIKKISQVFGRGIGISKDVNLSDLIEPKGCIDTIFTSHKNAPMSLLYGLGTPYNHVKNDELRLILRRDGHVAIAGTGNPLLEFYDGGWHTVDLEAGMAAIRLLLDLWFGDKSDQDLQLYVSHLAYHLATHWHGALFAIVEDEESVKDCLEEASLGSTNLLEEIQRRTKTDSLGSSIVGVKEAGAGRLLLSSAMHDGATLLDPKGKILGVGRIVKVKTDTEVTGGARTQAAKTMAQHGVAVKVSHDGGIVLFSTIPRDTGQLKKGDRIEVRIH